MKKLLCLILSAAALLLTGCDGGIFRQYSATEQLRTVSTLGLDIGPEGITVTAALDGVGGDSGGSILSCTARDIPEALTRLQTRAPEGQLFFAHVRHLLLGQAMAESGLAPLLDYVERDALTRMGTELYVLRDGRAEQLLRGIGDGDTVTALLDSVKRDTDENGSSHVTTLRDAAVALSQRNAAAICALRETEGEDGSPSAVPAGYGIIHQGVLAEFAEGWDAQVLSLLSGYPCRITRSFPTADGSVAVEIQGSPGFSRISECALHITLRAEAALVAVNAADAAVEDPAWQDSLTDSISAALTDGARQVIALAEALDADFPGLSRRTADGSFPRNVTISAETRLTQSYEMGNPLNPEDTV